ncbi:MAG TPA: hypothetical protein VH393_03785 [Ktedonobacterales bacterium]
MGARKGNGRHDPATDQSGPKRTELDDQSIIHHASVCADQLAELADMLAALARIREDGLLVRAALIYKDIAHSTATRFADLIGYDEGAQDE